MQRIHRFIHTLSIHSAVDLDLVKENYGRILGGKDPVSATGAAEPIGGLRFTRQATTFLTSAQDHDGLAVTPVEQRGKMKFGLAFASSVAIEHDDTLEICRRAEAAGFESLWGGEHVVLPTTIESRYPYTADGKIPAEPDTPVPDPLIWLAFAAAAAPTMRLGTCILIVAQRNPLVLAKELATLDRLSGGRVELGLGVGWLREEFEALGVPWERRGARNDEYIAAMRALWAGPHAEFHGEFVDFDPVTCSPRPIQDRLPILVGGDSEAAINRAVRLADGYFPGEGDAERLRSLLRRLRTAAEKADRDPDSIEINAMFVGFADPVGALEEMRDIGVGRVMLPAFFFAGPEGLDRLDQFGADVIPRFS